MVVRCFGYVVVSVSGSGGRLAEQGGQVMELLIMLVATSVVRRRKSRPHPSYHHQTTRPGDRDLAFACSANSVGANFC